MKQAPSNTSIIKSSSYTPGISQERWFHTIMFYTWTRIIFLDIANPWLYWIGWFRWPTRDSNTFLLHALLPSSPANHPNTLWSSEHTNYADNAYKLRRCTVVRERPKSTQNLIQHPTIKVLNIYNDCTFIFTYCTCTCICSSGPWRSLQDMNVA